MPSLDDGRPWRQANLEPARSPWEWRRWSLAVDAALGPLTLTARAWDCTGAAQPESAASLWNPNGYADTSWARIHLTVV
jgi:sulfite oxidase